MLNTFFYTKIQSSLLKYNFSSSSSFLIEKQKLKPGKPRASRQQGCNSRNRNKKKYIHIDELLIIKRTVKKIVLDLLYNFPL